MNDRKFWEAIAKIDQDVLPDEARALQPLIAYLETLDPMELIGFHNQLCKKIYRLDTREHFEAASQNQSDDSFLYLRCYVVGRGKDYFNKVLRNVEETPKEFVCLELLLDVAPDLWRQQKGTDLIDVCDRRFCVESGSNDKGWPEIPGALKGISFKETRSMIEGMLAADKRQTAAIGREHNYLGATIGRKLELLGFRAPGYSFIGLTVVPNEPHAAIKYIKPEISDELEFAFEVNILPRQYVEMDAISRDKLFVDLAFEALMWLAHRDGLDVSIIQKAKLAVYDVLAPR